MITFNTILRDEGIEPSKTKLVRHQDRRHKETPYDLWRREPTQFEFYQREQRRGKFGGADLIASFVATPLNETLFVGMYVVEGMRQVPKGTRSPLSGFDLSDHEIYDLTLTESLAAYRGRLIVDWGTGYRSWVQWANKQDKVVAELRRDTTEPPFPGLHEFQSCLSKLPAIPLTWRSVLSSVGGVYLLTCPETGKYYVGAAYGAGGFWQRWESYLRTGHGGNKMMKELPSSDYLISVLELAPLSARPEDVINVEDKWKRKLLTREFGLNAN